MLFSLVVQLFAFLFGKQVILLILNKSTEKRIQPSCDEQTTKKKGKRKKSGKEDEREKIIIKKREMVPAKGEAFSS